MSLQVGFTKIIAPSAWWDPMITVTRLNNYWYKNPYDFYTDPLKVPVVESHVSTIPTYELEFQNFAPWVPPDALVLHYSHEFANLVDTKQAECWPEDYQWKLLCQHAEDDFPLDKDERYWLYKVEFKEHYTKPQLWRKNRIMLLWMLNASLQAHSLKGVSACEKALASLFPDLWEPIHKKKVRKAIDG